jgi:hypothetical protein
MEDHFQLRSVFNIPLHAFPAFKLEKEKSIFETELPLGLFFHSDLLSPQAVKPLSDASLFFSAL